MIRGYFDKDAERSRLAVFACLPICAVPSARSQVKGLESRRQVSLSENGAGPFSAKSEVVFIMNAHRCRHLEVYLSSLLTFHRPSP